MKCKYCQAELEANSSVCPQCGKDNLKDDLKGLKITALVLVCVVMLVLLAGMVCYGVTGSFIPNFGGSDHPTESSGAVKDEHKVSTPGGIVTMTGDELKTQMDAVVATMGDHKLTNRQLQLYFWMAAYSYGEDADFTKPMSQQIYDEKTNQTYEQYLLEKAMETWQEVMLLSDAAKEAGFELPESYVKELEGLEEQLEYYVYMYSAYYGYDMETVDDFIQMQFGPGCDFATYYDYCYDYYLGGVYWGEKLTTLEVSDAEIEAYFKEHEKSLAEDYVIPVTKDFGDLIDVRSALIGVTTKEQEQEDGTKVKVEDWDSCLAEAQKLYDQYLAGELTEEAFIALVKEHSDDKETAANGGWYADLYSGCLSEVDVRHILIMPEGGKKSEDGTTTIYTEEEWAAAYTKAEQILNQWLSGEKTEASFGALANEHSDDNNGKVTNGGIYTDVVRGQMVKAFDSWCFDPSRQTGDYGIVKTEYGYHIMYFVRADREADTWAFDEARQAGDVTMVKTDNGYVLLYFVEAEPAWLRYCRYGAQAEKAGAMLEQMAKDNAYTLDDAKVVLAELES